MLVDYRIGRGKRRVLDLLAERGIDAPTVLMSGSDLEEVVSENGTQRCLVKPFTKAQLRQAIEAAPGLDEFIRNPIKPERPEWRSQSVRDVCFVP